MVGLVSEGGRAQRRGLKMVAPGAGFRGGTLFRTKNR